MLQEPIPGQPLNATWGRDVVREIRRLRPVGGPGMTVTYGPNGTTFAAKSGSASYSEATNFPFRLSMRSAVVSGVEQKYAVVYFQDGDAQIDSSSGVMKSDCANDAATGMADGWYDVAEYFNASGEQVTTKLSEAIIVPTGSTTGTRDVYAFVYEDTDGTIRTAFAMTEDWNSTIEVARRRSRLYVGTYTRTDTAVGSATTTTFAITTQAMRSGVASNNADDANPYPFQLKVDSGATGLPLVCYIPLACVDGNIPTIDNAEYGATGSGWYSVPYTRGATGIDINAYIDYSQEPPHVIVAATGPTAPSGYFSGSVVNVGRIETTTGPSGEDQTEITQQYQVGTAYRALSEFEPFKPFTIRCIDDGTETHVLCYMPVAMVDGQQATIVNEEYGATGSGWYEVEMGATGTPQNLSINAWLDKTSDNAPRIYLTDDDTGPTGYEDAEKVYVGEIVQENGRWRASEQYAVGSETRFNGEALYVFKWADDEPTANSHIKVKPPTYAAYTFGLPRTLESLGTKDSDGFYDLGDPASASNKPTIATGLYAILLHVSMGYGAGGTVRSFRTMLSLSKDIQFGVSIPATASTTYFEDTNGYFYAAAWNNTDENPCAYRVFTVGFAVIRDIAANSYCYATDIDRLQIDTFSSGGISEGGATGPTGATGESTTITSVSASASTVASGGQATAGVSEGGTSTQKTLAFTFGIPAGPTGATGVGSPGAAAGFGNIVATASSVEAGGEPTAQVSESGPDTQKNLSFTFGIPAGATGATGDDGGYYTPSIDATGKLTWDASDPETMPALPDDTFVKEMNDNLIDHASFISRILQDHYNPAPTAVTGQPATGGTVILPTGLIETDATVLKPDGATGSIGSSGPTGGKIVYSDHIHPIETGVGTLVQKTTSTTDATGDVPDFSFDTTEWTPGENGIEIPICVRCFKSSDSSAEYARCFVFRKVKLSKNGNVIHIGPEYVMYNAQYGGMS